MILVHKIALDPNRTQEAYFRRAAGTARFAYNWALREWQDQYEIGGQPSEISLRRLLNEIKDEKFPWMREVSKNVVQQAIKNLGCAFSRFFGRLKEHGPAEKRGEVKLGYPRFKKKGKSRDSFRADYGPQEKGKDAVRVDGRFVILPVIGRIRMRERLRFVGQVKSAIVSRTADRWFVALSVEVPDEVRPRKSHAVVGIDLGIKTLATVSDGREPYPAPKPTAKLSKKRRRLAKACSRKQAPAKGVKPSKNWLKAARQLARLDARIANIRMDATHKATTDIVRTCAEVVLEDLNVRGMMANGKLAKAISDVSFYEFRRQIEYKAKLHATIVTHAPRFYPSSRLCSDCGHRNDALTLKDRVWTCANCGAVHDRDMNAAKNLVSLAASTAVAACGAIGSGCCRKATTKPIAMKQEPERDIKTHVQEYGETSVAEGPGQVLFADAARPWRLTP